MNQAYGPASTFQIFAIKYATVDRTSKQNFIGDDDHESPMPLDYFVWVVTNKTHTFLVDTGFGNEIAVKRGRIITRPVKDGLLRIGLDHDDITDVIITHMHYDHCGNPELFENATYHVQDTEMSYCTGRSMRHPVLRQPYDAEDVKSMVDRIYRGKVQFHQKTKTLVPGISLHRIGGHTDGIQVVRVMTCRGWVVLASDTAHFYANIERGLPYPIVNSVAAMLQGHLEIQDLVDTHAHIIPGHDPLVLKRYPAAAEDTHGWIARVDLPPVV